MCVAATRFLKELRMPEGMNRPSYLENEIRKIIALYLKGKLPNFFFNRRARSLGYWSGHKAKKPIFKAKRKKKIIKSLKTLGVVLNVNIQELL